MSSVNATVSFSNVSMPANTPEVAFTRLQLMQGTYPAQTHDVAPASPLQFTFAGVAPETYTVRATALAANTGPIGNPVESAPFTVVADVERLLPSAITVTLG